MLTLQGIHCDTKGYVYAGCGDGVHVWNPAGQLIGKIYLGTTSANFQVSSSTPVLPESADHAVRRNRADGHLCRDGTVLCDARSDWGGDHQLRLLERVLRRSR